MFKEMAEDFPSIMETLNKQIWIQIFSIIWSNDSDSLLSINMIFSSWKVEIFWFVSCKVYVFMIVDQKCRLIWF